MKPPRNINAQPNSIPKDRKSIDSANFAKNAARSRSYARTMKSKA
jgi:hypothetical protein